MKFKRQRRAILLVAVVSLPFVLTIAWRLSRPKVFRATAAVRVSPTNEDAVFYSTNLQFETVSNLLSRAETIHRIAAMSGVNPSDFGLRSVMPVRNTRFVELRYYGSTSNGILCVASNASEIMAGFYRTNLTSVNVANFGSRIYEPASFWEYPLWRVKEQWNYPERFSAD